MSHTIKERVYTLIYERKFDELSELVVRKKGLMRYLYRLLYHKEKIVSWRSIEGIGVVVDRLAVEEAEVARNIIRSLLWSINDESGGIGWHAPECIGEIIYHRPVMFEEFASIIISFVNEQMIRSGVIWAAGRIAQAAPDLVRGAASQLIVFLDDSDSLVRGYTLRYLNIIGGRIDLKSYNNLMSDRVIIPVYENGQIKETTIADLAASLLH